MAFETNVDKLPNEQDMQKIVDNSADLDKPKYIRKDVKGGFLTNASEIKYYNQIEQIDVYDNLLLGDFEKNGEYKIDTDIKRELVGVKKYFVSAFGDTMFCESADNVAHLRPLDFPVKVPPNMPKQGYSTATLNVLETIDRANGYYQNTNTAFVASYSAVDGPSFTTDAFAKFHILHKKEVGGLEDKLPTQQFDAEMPFVVARKRKLFAQKKELMPHLDKFCQRVVDKKLKALGQSKIGQKIIDEFNAEGKTISGYFIKAGMEGYARYLNQMLDGVLDNHSEEILQDVKLKAQINEANTAFVDELNGKKVEDSALKAQTEQREQTVTSQQAKADDHTEIEEL